jgi:hypothetical protein
VSYSRSGKPFHNAGTSKMSVAEIVEPIRVAVLVESDIGKP